MFLPSNHFFYFLGQSCWMHQTTLGLPQKAQFTRSWKQTIFHPRQKDGKGFWNWKNTWIRHGQIPQRPFDPNWCLIFLFDPNETRPTPPEFNRIDDPERLPYITQSWTLWVLILDPMGPTDLTNWFDPILSKLYDIT